MKPDRESRRNSVCSAFTGVSMMRWPSGSVPASAPSSVRNMPLLGLVFGAVSLSITLIHGVAGIAEKYLAAALIFSSVSDFAELAIRPGFVFCGVAGFPG